MLLGLLTGVIVFLEGRSPLMPAFWEAAMAVVALVKEGVWWLVGVKDDPPDFCFLLP